MGLFRVIYFISLLLYVGAIAQDVQYSQFYATNIALNPAFTGATKYARATVAQRTQWPNSSGRVISYLAAYDRFFYYQKLGVGGLLQYDRLASGVINNLRVGPSASYVVFSEQNRNLRLAMGAYYTQKRYATSSLVFADQLDPDFGQIAHTSIDRFDNLTFSKSYFDATAGFLYNTTHFWIGGAAHHLNRPSENINMNNYKTPLRLGVHTGYKIDLKDDRGLATKQEQNITLTANLKNQGKATQLDLGAYVILEPITFGAWYRGIPVINSNNGYVNQDALVFMLGLDYMDLRIGYSYDVTISKLGLKTGGTHELSLIWEFGEVSDLKKRKPGKMKTMYMPYPKL